MRECYSCLRATSKCFLVQSVPCQTMSKHTLWRTFGHNPISSDQDRCCIGVGMALRMIGKTDTAAATNALDPSLREAPSDLRIAIGVRVLLECTQAAFSDWKFFFKLQIVFQSGFSVSDAWELAVVYNEVLALRSCHASGVPSGTEDQVDSISKNVRLRSLDIFRSSAARLLTRNGTRQKS